MNEPERREPSGVTEWRMQELMARLDERTSAIQTELKTLREQMVTQTEIRPMRMLLYGLVGIILTSVVGGLMALLLNAPR